MTARRVAYACGAVLCAAALAHHAVLLSGRARKRVQTTELAMALDQFPMQLDGWRGRDVPLDEDVIETAGFTTHLNREYVAPDGGRVALYIAYYAHVMDRVPHGPTICLPYHGWHKKEGRVIHLPTEAPEYDKLKVEKLVYERDFSEAVFFYWYAANGRQMIGERRMYAESAWKRLAGLFGMGGGYLVQISVSAQVTDSKERAFERVERFFRQNFDAIARHFPQPDSDHAGGDNAS